MKSTTLICGTSFCATALAHPGHSSDLYNLMHPETIFLLIALIPLAICASRMRMPSLKWQRKTQQQIDSD